MEFKKLDFSRTPICGLQRRLEESWETKIAQLFCPTGKTARNRRVPSELLCGIEGDEPAHAQDPGNRRENWPAGAGDQAYRAGRPEEEVAARRRSGIDLRQLNHKIAVDRRSDATR